MTTQPDKGITVVDWGGFRKELAGELHKRGLLARYLTTNPRWKAAQSGIPAELIRSRSFYRYLEAGLARSPALEKKFASALKLMKDRNFVRFVPDNIVPGTTVCFLSGSGEGVLRARENGRLEQPVKCILQRGSAHITWLEDLLDREYAVLGIRRKRLAAYYLEKEEYEYSFADRIVVPSAVAAKTYVSRGVDPEKISVISLGAPPLPPRQDVADKSRALQGKLIYVGQLSVRKGFHILAEVLRTSKAVKELIVIGNVVDPEVVAALKDDPRVVWKGALPREQVMKELAHADALVLPSVEDGFGRVVTEAFVAGIPAIVSDCCGASEVVLKTGGGIVYDATSREELRDAIERLLTDEAFNRSCREAIASGTGSSGGWEEYTTGFLNVVEQTRSR
ncbi:glycosyltransferase family 4 protein [Luteolibacter yonseiensis]|uniref:Glycosyltransferase family 4 protein n=1 Tax=Luteolibacter yonseiensis TaxID=1144680 RepID=A0A934VCM6_9BACT|nr:glycosyltransferase family 4 protein [Luteolibacter yonseiensis]MBK1817131.1 glycosyltransferase family 4 protein [Luteolibacter yonseiensis]